MRYVVFHTHGGDLVLAPVIVERLKALPDVIDVREVGLWSMQTYFWEGLETQIAEASATEGCEFVLWGPQNRYGNCPVRCVELDNYSDVSNYCQGKRSRVETLQVESGAELKMTVWENPQPTSA